MVHGRKFTIAALARHPGRRSVAALSVGWSVHRCAANAGIWRSAAHSCGHYARRSVRRSVGRSLRPVRIAGRGVADLCAAMGQMSRTFGRPLPSAGRSVRSSVGRSVAAVVRIAAEGVVHMCAVVGQMSGRPCAALARSDRTSAFRTLSDFPTFPPPIYAHGRVLRVRAGGWGQ